MGINVVLTPEDLKKGDLVAKPGWQPVEVIEYVEEVTKGTDEKPSDGSLNCIFKFKILDGAQAGVELRTQWNEKALGMGKKFYEAVGIPQNPEGGYILKSSTFEKTQGVRLDVYVKRSKSQRGKDFNEITDFRKSE